MATPAVPASALPLAAGTPTIPGARATGAPMACATRMNAASRRAGRQGGAGMATPAAQTSAPPTAAAFGAVLVTVAPACATRMSAAAMSAGRQAGAMSAGAGRPSATSARRGSRHMPSSARCIGAPTAFATWSIAAHPRPYHRPYHRPLRMTSSLSLTTQKSSRRRAPHRTPRLRRRRRRVSAA